MYDSTTSIFAWMSTVVALQTAPANAQQAYLDLSIGNQEENFSYSQGGFIVGNLLTSKYRRIGHV